MCKWLLLLSMITCFHGCREERKINRSVYHWKTVFDPTVEELHFMQQHDIHTLYLHLFDVKIENGGVVPVAKTKLVHKIPGWVKVIPVVYITNASFEKTPAAETDSLAMNIFQLISDLLSHQTVSFKEIQIDCDWTERTREKYFHFLTAIKKFSLKNISVTIRLHQLKYKEKTGVPPVDKGMLMFYNMGQLNTVQNTNSIFDPVAAQRYLERGMEYPLPLDLALACFRWEVVLRQGKVIALLNEPVADSLAALHLVKGTRQVSQVRTGFLHQGCWFQPGDIIRSEQAGYNEMMTALDLLKDRLNYNTFNLAIYHWHPYFFRELNHEKTDRLYSVLQ